MKKRVVIPIVLTAAAAAFLAGVSMGTEFINPIDLLSIIMGDGDSLKSEIILKLRLPRVLAALFVGASLSVCGAVFQSVFRNPLADPFITGVSGGAALGYSVAVIFSFPHGLGVVSAFCGSALSIMFIYVLSARAGFSGSSFILSGVAMSFIFSSSVMLLFSIAKSESVHRTIIWMMGDLGSSGGRQGIIFVIAAGIMVALWLFHRHLDIIAFGAEFSKSSGVSQREIRIIVLLASSLTALTVVVGGIVPFVGLMVPHIVRIVSRSGSYVLIPLSALAGGAFLMICDALSRTLVVPYEIPVGVITGLSGGLFFLYYVLRSRREL